MSRFFFEIAYDNGDSYYVKKIRSDLVRELNFALEKPRLDFFLNFLHRVFHGQIVLWKNVHPRLTHFYKVKYITIWDRFYPNEKIFYEKCTIAYFT